VSALIVPAFVHVRKWLADHNIEAPQSNYDLIKKPEVIELIQKQIDKYNPLFSHPEQIKKLTLLPNEWTVDTGELTPSLKIRRKIIEQKYTSEINALYEE